MHEPSIFALTSPALIARGYSPLPILPGSKAPGTDYLMKKWARWCSEIPPPNVITGWSHYPDCGVGVCLGRGLICVDVDLEKAVAPLLAILPPSPVQKKGRKGISLFYRGNTEKIRSKNFRTPERVGLVDLLAEGKQTVLPPSIHPETGEPYYWWTDDTLLDLRLEDLPELDEDVADQIAEVLKQFGYDPEGDRVFERSAGFGETLIGGNAPAGGGDVATLFRQVNDLALANLHAWVLELKLPKCHRRGASFAAVAFWRSSGSGRPLYLRAPNLSFRADGIRDFGDDRGYTPIDVVMKAHGVSASEALDWLAPRVGAPLHDHEAAAMAERIVAKSKKKKERA